MFIYFFIYLWFLRQNICGSDTLALNTPFFLSLTSVYILTVGVEIYCSKLSHSVTHTHNR
jgi:hypothetical protein